GEPPCFHVLAQSPDFWLLFFSKLKGVNGYVISSPRSELDLLMAREEFEISAGNVFFNLVVIVLDGIVEDLLGQPSRPPGYIDPAKELQKGPYDLLPSLLVVQVPIAPLEMDRLESRPEN